MTHTGESALPAGTDLVIFDWDGTLVDSRGVIVATMQTAMAEEGLEPLPGEEIQQIIGLGLDEALRTLLPGADEASYERLRLAYGNRFQSYAATTMPFFSGAPEGLDELQASGVRLAVATGKSRRGLDRMLKEWGMTDFFHATRCADETASKPDPRMLREILADLETPLERAVFVGDTAFDMEMGYRMGMPRVAVTYGVHPADRLAPWRPQGWAHSFADVMAHILPNEQDLAVTGSKG